MALAAKYQQFLASPTTAVLADNASLNYVPTLTSLHGSTSILKHIAAQDKAIKKKAEKFLSATENANTLCVEVDTTLEIVNSGGAYLPGLDDNFLTDKTVNFPVIHLVNFSSNNTITSIRLHWDQGSLLKQVEIIGARSRNWPIRDGKDQIKLIKTINETASSNGGGGMGASNTAATSGNAPSESSNRSHASSNASSSSNPSKGPKASLSLFEPQSPAQSEFDGPVVSPRTATKPLDRNLADILSGVETSDEASTNSSPRKSVVGGAQRIGAEKHFQPMRLFDQDETPNDSDRPDIKTNPLKFNHFEFGNGEMAPPPRPLNSTTSRIKHQSQWDFSDFVTPEKQKPKVLPHSRNFSFDDSNNKNDDPTTPTSPSNRAIVHKPRPDAEPHFEFKDDGTPKVERIRTLQKGRHHDGLGLYQDNVMATDDNSERPSSSLRSANVAEEDAANGHGAGHKTPLAPIAGSNVNTKGRHNTFDAHYEISDSSPSVSFPKGQENIRKPAENQSKVLNSLNSSWDLYDQSPSVGGNKDRLSASSNSSNLSERGIKTRGNGMGGRKDGGVPWDIAEDDDDVQNVDEKKKTTTTTQTTKPLSGTAARKAAHNQPSELWGF